MRRAHEEQLDANALPAVPRPGTVNQHQSRRRSVQADGRQAPQAVRQELKARVRLPAARWLTAGQYPRAIAAGKRLAPQVGLEPTTLRLTAGCSTIELLRNNSATSLSIAGRALPVNLPPGPKGPLDSPTARHRGRPPWLIRRARSSGAGSPGCGSSPPSQQPSRSARTRSPSSGPPAIRPRRPGRECRG